MALPVSKVVLVHRTVERSVAAGILLSILVVGWILFPGHDKLPAAETAVLDLKNQSVARGADQAPAEAPLAVSRYASRWEIQLPLGSPDGPYQVLLTTEQGKEVLATRGVAKITGGITLLRVDVRLSSAGPGLYVLQLQKPTSIWSSYPVALH